MQVATKTGNPVNPPIWWIDPENPETYSINDGKFKKKEKNFTLVHI